MQSKKRIKQFVKVFMIAFSIQAVFFVGLFFLLYKTMPEGYNMDRVEKIQAAFDDVKSKIKFIKSEDYGPIIDDFIDKYDVMVYLTDKVSAPDNYKNEEKFYITNSKLSAISKDDVIAYWGKVKDDDYVTTCGTDVYFLNENNSYTVKVMIVVAKENFILVASRKYIPLIILITTSISLICSFVFSLNKEIKHSNKLEAERSVFFSSAAHELKTPLSIIDGQLSGMIEGISGYEDHDKYMRKSLENVKRMEQTVKNIIAVSRLQAGSVVLDESINIADIVTELMNIYGDMFDKKNIVVDVNVDRELVTRGSYELIRDTIGAFLSNAYNYSPKGADVSICGTKVSNGIKISVENTGVHIDEEHLKHIFEAFYRTDKSRNSNTGGSGLGLYLVKLVAENYGGSCAIENTDKGVKSTIVLPA